MSGMSVAGAGSQRPASAFAGITAPKPGFLFHAFGIRSRRFMHNLREVIKEDARNRLNVTDPREVKQVVRQVLDRMGMSSLSKVEAGSEAETQTNLERLKQELHAPSMKAFIEGERAKQRAGEAFNAHLIVSSAARDELGGTPTHSEVVKAIGKGIKAAFPDAKQEDREIRVLRISTAALKADPQEGKNARFDTPEKIREAGNRLLAWVGRESQEQGKRQGAVSRADKSLRGRIMQAFPTLRQYGPLVVEQVLAHLGGEHGESEDLTKPQRLELKQLLRTPAFKAMIIREVEDAALGGDFPASWEEVAVPDGLKA